jgi:hypothetical protein
MRYDDTIIQTINLLAAARIAIYPVDVRGATIPLMNTAENKLDPTINSVAQLMGPPPAVTADAPNAGTGGFSGGLLNEGQAKNSSDTTMDMLAEKTGGKAFYNQNDLSGIINKVASHSLDFYTLSYSPNDEKMDGGARKIEVKVGDNEHYNLSYRREYFARNDDALPGSAQFRQEEAAQRASHDPTKIDPLAPFMVFGMPQSEQILYKTLVQHMPPKQDVASSAKPNMSGPADRYSVDFAVDLKDLNLKLDSNGLHSGTLNLSMIVYDKYGRPASRENHLVQLNIKPDVYTVFQKTGVQLHGEVVAPKGQFWLRTGVYDESSRKVGTLEVPLSSVKDSVASR